MSGGSAGKGEPAASAAAARQAFDGPVRHVYVHVPFCRAKCDYCDFASSAVGEDPDEALLERFVDGIAAEWELERAAYDVRRLHTLYLGGGTPSLLGPDRLERLLELFRPHLTPRAEVTVEANPEDVDEDFAAWAAAARRGVRVSVGVQSFEPALRAALGRRAQADPVEAFRRLRAAGVRDLSVDLIQGIPGQTLALLEADLAQVLDLMPDHVSCYELTLAAGTPLARRLSGSRSGDGVGRAGEVRVAATTGTAGDPTFGTTGGTTVDPTFGTAARGTLPVPGVDVLDAGAEAADDARADLFEHVVRRLSRAGYDWYEVSNFARPGHKARHNLAYWRARPYLGLGPGAVSTVGARRWTNLPDPDAWARALGVGGAGGAFAGSRAGASPPREVEDLDAAARARERLLLAARCGDRVPLEEIAGAVDLRAAPPLVTAGLVSLHSGTIRVTRKGRHVANEVCVRLFRAPHLRR